MESNFADFNRIFVLQKRAFRAIYNLDLSVLQRYKFKEINILTLALQHILENSIYDED